MTAGAADPPRGAVVGCSYFGVRILRHVARDMEDLVRRGFTGVLHTFSENDLAYYRETMGRIEIESKDEARSRGIDSPDRAEALIMAYWKFAVRQQTVQEDLSVHVSPY